MLAVIAVFLQCMLLIGNYQNIKSTLPIAFFFGLPCLFAAGVGALLVGQERENRTFYWMASLPINKLDIIGTKYFAGVAGLGAVWIISFLMMLISGGLSNASGPISVREIDWLHGLLYSLFMLVLGFATAWSIRSTFVGLLFLAGIALGYTFATNFFFTSSQFHALALITASAVTFGAGWVAAHRALAPTGPPMFSQRAIQGSAYFDRSLVDHASIQTPWSALIWQFSAQNRAILLGLSALFLISILIACFAIGLSSRQNFRSQEPLASLVLGFVAISWLGVVTFQGDNIHQRVRFLSDRGIVPRTVWLTRQTIPLGLLIIGVMALALATSITLIWFREFAMISEVFLWVLLACGLIWTIYSVTQWMSQVIRSPIVAAILAPIVGCLPFAYGSIAFEILETPIWLLAIVTLIPMIATYRMTRHWMDARLDARFWLEHAGWLSLALLIPAMPFFIVYATYPSMPANEWIEFQREYRKIATKNRSNIEIWLLAPSQPDSEQGDDNVGLQMGEGLGGAQRTNGTQRTNELPKSVSLTEERELQLDFIDSQLKSLDNMSQLSSSYRACSRLMGDAMLTRVRMEDDGISESMRKRYQRNVGILVRIFHGV